MTIHSQVLFAHVFTCFYIHNFSDDNAYGVYTYIVIQINNDAEIFAYHDVGQAGWYFLHISQGLFRQGLAAAVRPVFLMSVGHDLYSRGQVSYGDIKTVLTVTVVVLKLFRFRHRQTHIHEKAKTTSCLYVSS